MSKKGKSRLSLEVPTDLLERARQHMPHGIRSEIIRVLLSSVLDAVERQGTMVLGAVMDGEFRLVYNPRTEHDADKL